MSWCVQDARAGGRTLALARCRAWAELGRKALNGLHSVIFNHNFFDSSSGLVAEYIVAIDVTRVDSRLLHIIERINGLGATESRCDFTPTRQDLSRLLECAVYDVHWLSVMSIAMRPMMPQVRIR